jgi:hypothetical protein
MHSRRLLAALIISAFSADCFGGPMGTVDIPSLESQTTAQTTIAEVYRDEYKGAKTPADRAALANKLIQVADATADDLPAQYDLLRIAKNLSTSTAPTVHSLLRRHLPER